MATADRAGSGFDGSGRRRHGLLRDRTASIRRFAPIAAEGQDTVDFALQLSTINFVADTVVAAGLRRRRARAARATSSAVGSVIRVVRLRHLVARGFRNLADLECELPPVRRGSAGRQRAGQDQPARGHLLPGAVPLLPGRAGPGDRPLRRARLSASRRRSRAARGRRSAPRTAPRPAQANPGRWRGARAAGRRGRRLARGVVSPGRRGARHRARRRAARLPRPAPVAGRPPVPAVRSRATARRWRSGTARCGRAAPSWRARSTRRSPTRAPSGADAAAVGRGGGGAVRARSSTAWARAPGARLALPGHRRAGRAGRVGRRARPRRWRATRPAA